MNVQYWRSFEDLEKFARRPSDPHLQVWKDYNQRIGSDGSVGIWHETYLVNNGKFECVYGNMPLFGLAAATRHVAAVGNRETARLRIGGQSEPASRFHPSLRLRNSGEQDAATAAMRTSTTSGFTVRRSGTSSST